MIGSPTSATLRKCSTIPSSVELVQGGRQQQNAVTAVFLGVLGPLLRLVPADAVDTGDHQTAAVDRVDGDLHDLAPLLVGQRRVLAEGAVRPDATATVAHQEVDVFAELVVVDSQTCRRRIVRLEGQAGGDDDTAEIHAVFTHTDFLSDVVVD